MFQNWLLSWKEVFDIFLVKIIFRLKCFSQPDNLYLLEISDI